MPLVPSKENRDKVERAVKWVTSQKEDNKPMPTMEEISKKFGIDLGVVNRKVVVQLKINGIIESEKRRAAYYYKSEK